MGMIPEGLFLLASVTLVLSAVRLAQKKVLVHDMKCIETLARVDVLCVDKTGTITTEKMNVERVVEISKNSAGSDSLDTTSLLDFVSGFQAEDNETIRAIKR